MHRIFGTCFLFTIACATAEWNDQSVSGSKEDSNQDASPSADGSSKPRADADINCKPKVCGDACGAVDDGCGAILDCGTCPPECPPLVCETNDCGTKNDACGNTIECTPCQQGCTDDTYAGNNESSTAADLGTYNDLSTQTKWIDKLVLTNDADWFRVGVDDACCGTNPTAGVAIRAVNATRSLRVTIRYACDVGGEAVFTCVGGEFLPNENACRMVVPSQTAEQWLRFDGLDCAGTSEDGVVIAEITAEPGETCDAYELGFEVKGI